MSFAFITMDEVGEENVAVPGIVTTLHASFKPAIGSYFEGLYTSPVYKWKGLVEGDEEKIE